MQDTGASLLVTDYAPLRLGRLWREAVAGKVEVPFHEVDAHNVVPVWVASGAISLFSRDIRPSSMLSCRGGAWSSCLSRPLQRGSRLAAPDPPPSCPAWSRRRSIAAAEACSLWNSGVTPDHKQRKERVETVYAVSFNTHPC